MEQELHPAIGSSDLTWRVCGPLPSCWSFSSTRGYPEITGGFVGVDVFFVVSGFVITGLLLREHASSRKTRLLAFYGRRSRRILPAATLVIILTVLASYHWLGFLVGDDTAPVGRTASLFYANFHFISTETNYLASQAPPSALQNYWSLSVEEQSPFCTRPSSYSRH